MKRRLTLILALLSGIAWGQTPVAFWNPVTNCSPPVDLTLQVMTNSFVPGTIQGLLPTSSPGVVGMRVLNIAPPPFLNPFSVAGFTTTGTNGNVIQLSNNVPEFTSYGAAMSGAGLPHITNFTYAGAINLPVYVTNNGTWDYKLAWWVGGQFTCLQPVIGTPNKINLETANPLTFNATNLYTGTTWYQSGWHFWSLSMDENSGQCWMKFFTTNGVPEAEMESFFTDSNDQLRYTQTGNNENGQDNTTVEQSANDILETNTPAGQSILPLIASTNIAVTANYSDVLAAYNNTPAGGTLVIPAGNVQWGTNCLLFTNVSILGAPGETVINLTTNASTAFVGVNSTANFYQFSGLIVNPTNPVSADYQGSIIKLTGTWDVNWDSFTNLGASLALLMVADCGVVHNSSFYYQCVGSIAEVWGSGYGDTEWSQAVGWGTTNFVTFENDVLSVPPAYTNNITGGLPPVDYNNGARLTVRYCNLTNVFIQEHGEDSTGRGRGGLALELYENNFTEFGPRTNQDAITTLRGGTALIWSNNIVGFTGLSSLINFRSTTHFDPFGSANGLNTWDSNTLVQAASGTATTGSGSQQLVDSSKTWTINQFTPGYEILDLTQGGTNDPTYAIITSNNVNTIFCTQISHNNQFFSPAVGDSYAIYQVLKALDQVGTAGPSDLIADVVGGDGIPSNTVTHATFSWPHLTLTPVWDWSNNVNGKLVGMPGTLYNVIQVGVDTVDSQTNYTPLNYPYAYTNNTGGGGGNLGFTNTGASLIQDTF